MVAGVADHGRPAVQNARSRILTPALTPTGNTCSRIWQHPRFVAKKRGSTVEIRCHVEDDGLVSWFRKPKPDSEPKTLHAEQGRILQSHNKSEAVLTILSVQFQDNGIYFCKQECAKGTQRTEHGCGTELRVMGVCGAHPSTPLPPPARESMGCSWSPTNTHPTPPHPSPPPVGGRVTPCWVAVTPGTWESRGEAGPEGSGPKAGTGPTKPHHVHPPPPRVQHLGPAEAAEHTERWHHHDPDLAYHSVHHCAHLPAAGQGDRGGRPDTSRVSVSPAPEPTH